MRKNGNSLTRVIIARGQNQTGRKLWLYCVVLTIASAGCNNMIRRGQSPDESMLKFNDSPVATRYVSDLCSIWGLNYAKIEGVGLVTGLEGTGSDPPPSGQRDFLLRNLKSETIKNPKAALASKNTSIALIKAMLPPGIRKGDHFDIEVATMTEPKTDTTSLQYGILSPTQMQALELLGRRVRKGSVTATAEGRVLVDAIFESRQDTPNQLRGVILGGGVALEDRPVGLAVRADDTTVRLARSISHSINQRFTTYGDDGRQGVAVPKTDRVIELLIPSEYKHNIGRFFQVLIQIAVGETPDERVNRLDRLDLEINDPATAQQAALQLEAIGDEAIPTLKRALRHQDLEVRFQAAHALAYMAAADGVDILKEAAKTEPAFRWHALAALASLEDSGARTALEDLVNVDSAETRYGAFRALQARSPGDRLVSGNWLADDFFFHVLPSTVDPMLHFSRSKKPEIVLFGEHQLVKDDFLYVEAGLTVQAIGNDRVQLTRYLPVEGEIRKTCSNEIRDVIQTLADVGIDYTTMIKMFRDAAQRKTLDTRMVVNAVPRIGNQKRSLQAGEVPPEKSERFVAEPLPDLFSDGSEPVSTIENSVEKTADPREEKTKDTITAKTRGGLLNRIKRLADSQ